MMCLILKNKYLLVIAIGVCCVWTIPLKGQQTVQLDSRNVIEYVLSCQKPNGAFGPGDQAYTDVAWTYPAVRTLQLLGTPLPAADSCLSNGGQSWMEKAKWKNGPWYWSFYQKALLFALYGRHDHQEPEIVPGLSWKLSYVPRKNYTEFRNYLKGEFFDLESLWHTTAGIQALGGNIRETSTVADFVAGKQLSDGGFSNHIIQTHAAVRTLSALGLSVPNSEQCIDWLRSCQREDGGFGWSPAHTAVSNRSDVWYTWAAVMALHELGAKPKQWQACIDWLNDLQNTDGGFGDQQGWNSRLYSTYYAVETLQILTGDAVSAISRKNRTIPQGNPIPEGKYRIFQTQHKTPSGGQGMVDSMVNLGFHLIGVKTKEKEVLDGNGMSRIVLDARAYVDQKGYELEVVDNPENYAHRLIWFDGQHADHVSNFMIPPDMDSMQREQFLASYRAGKDNLPWVEFKKQVIEPMVAMGTLFYPELDYTMANAYLVYDEGLYGGGGYNAVPGAHFGNIDWVRHFPYHERWVGKLPIIADGDAHGDMVGWHKNLMLYRNVFLAQDNSLAAYTDAAKNGRSVCVIALPDGEVRYYGTPEAVAYLKKHLDKWKWW
ncbi:MAG TPA: prenyltransferase/squalene oxidase repeat-containing protein [Sphingobacterium sp.]|nr:prenyltransferase/squalene oxidase repeat-containing protein [Sphingobacterium sp.]